jgi:hypothetical protein
MSNSSISVNPDSHVVYLFQEAATNGLREALRSFGCHFTGKVNESAHVPVKPNILKTSLQMDKQGLTHAGRMYFSSLN